MIRASDLLGIGRSGMTAASFGASNASQNAANATTEGYTRRIARFDPLGPRPLAGVRARGANRVVDPFLERRLLGAEADRGRAEAEVRTLEVLDTAFADGPGGLPEALAGLEVAASRLSANPDENAARITFLDRAAALAQAFRQTAGLLEGARQDANDRLRDGVREVNEKLTSIGRLSEEIARIEAIGEEASDLRDRRDQLVREVAAFVPVKVLEAEDGRIDLLLAGSRALVDREGQVAQLGAVVDPATGDVRVVLPTAGLSDDVTGLLSSGSLGGLVAARDGELARARTDLDQLAADLAAAYNGIHAGGVGADGTGGRNLFTPPAGVDGAALNLTLSGDVAGRPERVAAALDPASLPGDNRNALALAGLADQPFASGGTETAVEALGSLVGAAGAGVRTATTELERATDVAAQVDALRQSVSGVVTDEELIDLAQFQRSFQAAARVVQVADEMLGEIVNLKR
ncbi:MAG TPA: flagellar hook-associated protein FlgK [Polyangiaceae bacterium LLY-WYZ-14_1]|nr:flagellar hook-associated protein FlgK [Polyangiaceae bacterium LLY-WYZ-14_1]